MRSQTTLINSELKHNKVEDEMKVDDCPDSRHGYGRIGSGTHTDGNLESEVHLQKRQEPVLTSSQAHLSNLLLLQPGLPHPSWSGSCSPHLEVDPAPGLSSWRLRGDQGVMVMLLHHSPVTPVRPAWPHPVKEACGCSE